MKKFRIVFMIALIASCAYTLESCKKSSKEIKEEINAKHEANRKAVKKKLTKKYCYEITKIALGQKFSRIDTIIITKYDASATNIGEWKDAKYNAYVRTDGNVTGKIMGQEGTYKYWFETQIEPENIDSKTFNVESLFAKDSNGLYVIYRLGLNDYSESELKKMNEETISRREFAKKMELNIDGIQVRFSKKSNLGGVTGLYYDSDKELSYNQMKKAVKKITVYFDFVEFSLKGRSYAYYDREGDYVSHDLR